MVRSIGDRATFEAFRRSRARGRRGPISVVYVPTEIEGPPRVAYALGKRLGNAVTRNRIRRRLRAAVAAEGSALAPGSYLVSANVEVERLPFEELRKFVVAAIQQAGRGTE